MTFVQYYWRRDSGEFVEALGDRSVVVLDGRKTVRNLKKDAIEMNGYRRPFYDAFRIFVGKSFARANYVTELIPITESDRNRSSGKNV